jgi:hypothetical protein
MSIKGRRNIRVLIALARVVAAKLQFAREVLARMTDSAVIQIMLDDKPEPAVSLLLSN